MGLLTALYYKNNIRRCAMKTYSDEYGIFIFRVSKKLPDGRILYAKACGKRAFKIYIKKFA